ncbi:MAG: SCO family protein [Planctomycetes bacterium]|nr:SCO family protein [Planctomycetota bacterium]
MTICSRTLFASALAVALTCCAPAPDACCDGTPAAADPLADPPPGESLFLLEHAFTDQAGRDRRLRDFAGHPTLVAMIFTNCAYACPVLVKDVQEVVARPEVGDDLHVLLVSMDVARDDPGTLRRFADDHGLAAHRYTLLHGDQDAVDVLAAVLGVRIAPVADGGFSHSNRITLLDEEGVVRHRLDGLGADAEPLLEAIQRLSPR